MGFGVGFMSVRVSQVVLWVFGVSVGVSLGVLGSVYVIFVGIILYNVCDNIYNCLIVILMIICPL